MSVHRATAAACSAAGVLVALQSHGTASRAEEERPRLTPYTRSVDFPPKEIGSDSVASGRWYEHIFAAVPPKAKDPTMTAREQQLYKMSATAYVEARRAGSVTCEEYARALVKRARYYRYLNQWIYNTYDRLDTMVDQARALDVKAASEGVESIAPFYGLPIPMKGTAAVIDFPSGSGCGILSGYTPTKDSDLTTLIRSQNGLIFGCTNVPEFASSWQTANPASGQTRNIYGHKLTVGGSSGGAASAVANYNCPLAVTEDTGGSTRVPASCNQNFGFDPSRNHYRNDGNPGMSFTNDQLGVNARSIEDILLYDACLLPELAAERAAAKQRVAVRPTEAIRIGTPLLPFVHELLGEGLARYHGSNIPTGACRTLNADVRGKYERVKVTLGAAGFCLSQAEWPSSYFGYLRREENVCVEATHTARPVNGSPISHNFAGFRSFSGQVAEFVHSYYDAPLSLKDLVGDIGQAGHSHNPGGLLKGAGSLCDETQFRYWMGPKIKQDLDAYNSYFDTTGAELILLPSGRCATPDLAKLASHEVPLTCLSPGSDEPREKNGAGCSGSSGDNGCSGDNGTEEEEISYVGAAGDIWMDQIAFKHLHIPKMVIPTGLTEDGRPTAVQVWGKAVPYELMFDDEFSAKHDLEFLYLVQRVSAAIQADAALQRADAQMAKGSLQE
jgi:Asp-tRNA(Asn)/Glu-tRNA(Gln) amidotransferase A subunit family amidase